MSKDNPLARRETYKFWTPEKIRYADTDRQGHVNNAVFATFCESGRVALFFETGEELAPQGCEFVIARLELDFRAEMRWPGHAEIGTVALDIGRSSFRLGQGIFNGDVCAATAETVIVLLDTATRRATPLPDATRAGLLARAGRGAVT
jgi:acyl-CoA thioester hydrolase